MTNLNLQIRKKNKSKTAIVSLLIFLLLLSFTVCFVLVYYGPFTNIKKYIVGTAMSSKTHQYLATMFLSQAEIDRLIKTDIIEVEQDSSNIEITDEKADDIISSTIDGDGQFQGYALIIKDPTRLKIGLTSKLGEQGETTEEIAKTNDAVAAINGGGFSDKSTSGKLWSGTGAYPTYFVIHEGRIAFTAIAGDYAFTNEPDRSASVVAFDKNGTLIVGKHSLQDLLKRDVKEAVVFGPALVINGKGTFKGDGGQGMTARTAIGQCANGDIIMVVADGRRLDLPGATLGDMRNIMLKYGAVTAVNLDGGSSTTMYYDGKIINTPCDPLGQRSIPTVLYVAKRGQ